MVISVQCLLAFPVTDSVFSLFFRSKAENRNPPTTEQSLSREEGGPADAFRGCFAENRPKTALAQTLVGAARTTRSIGAGGTAENRPEIRKPVRSSRPSQV